MKPKYIKRYKNSLNIKRQWWRFICSKYFRKNKNHSRRRLLRKIYIINFNKLNKFLEEHIITKEELISMLDKGIQEMMK